MYVFTCAGKFTRPWQLKSEAKFVWRSRFQSGFRQSKRNFLKCILPPFSCFVLRQSAKGNYLIKTGFLFRLKLADLLSSCCAFLGNSLINLLQILLTDFGETSRKSLAKLSHQSCNIGKKERVAATSNSCNCIKPLYFINRAAARVNPSSALKIQLRPNQDFWIINKFRSVNCCKIPTCKRFPTRATHSDPPIHL